MKTIKLSNGGETLVDDEDYENLNQFRWRRAVRGAKTYVVRTVGTTRASLYMHRVITQAPKGVLVDHRNLDGLDNRRSNLRLCTMSDNQANRPGLAGTSRYKGVYWFKRTGKWMAQIKGKGIAKGLGYYDNEEGAARAYDKAAKELFGEFAWLNFQEAA